MYERVGGGGGYRQRVVREVRSNYSFRLIASDPTSLVYPMVYAPMRYAWAHVGIHGLRVQPLYDISARPVMNSYGQRGLRIRA